MMAENESALIIFSRLPIGKETKTRLSPLLNEKQRKELHLAMWHDIFSEVRKLTKQLDVFLYWTGSGDIKDYLRFIPSSFSLKEQSGIDLGERMSNAMMDIMKLGYRRVAIIGADIPSLKAENIVRAFKALNTFDIVIGPSEDGGYWLIGMRKFVPEVFKVDSWGNSSVLNSTIEKVQTLKLTHMLVDTLQDIDTPDDVMEFMKRNCNKSNFVYKYLRN